MSSFSWQQDLQAACATALSDPTAATSLADSRLAAQAGDIEHANHLLTSTISVAACKAGRSSGFQPGRNIASTSHAPFYDAECRAAHSALPCPPEHLLRPGTSLQQELTIDELSQKTAAVAAAATASFTLPTSGVTPGCCGGSSIAHDRSCHIRSDAQRLRAPSSKG